MTLSDLAALAAEKVDGFVRPAGECCFCDGGGFVSAGRDFATRCGDCAGTGVGFNDCPAALLMAVVAYQLKGNRKLETDRGDILIRRGDDWWCVSAGKTQESIARAALVALLRAHGVEVADE